ncbi:hypothetical protein F0562_017672 [Nyssa sinensis]|uniref:3'-5' exonuclease domain-containing protein n=1 Tax=Nyssa sinensis TaxID=561372 RepID=A0A5J4ZH63_9ASTE|nr:hypothetical protein F0562_017672 [Nyssa sinensis]
MTISIIDHELPFLSHDLYDVTFYDDEIETLVTHCPSMVKAWIRNTEILNRRRLHRLIVGLDVEWRPSFSRRVENPVAILQLCVGHSCLIFQLLYARRIPQLLTDFLQNPNYTFVGVGIDGDVNRLSDDYDLEVSNTVDLRGLAARELGVRELRRAGLKELAREVLGKELKKPMNVTLSKWDEAWLSDAQVALAAEPVCFLALQKLSDSEHY